MTTLRVLSERIRTRSVSPLEIVRECLGRIEKRNAELNAFITVLAEPALEQARTAEAEISAGHWRGPLHGIPVGIKDFYDTAGIRTTAAAEQFKERVPAADAAAVAKLKRAGAIVIGKTNMHQLGMGTTGLESWFGPVRNPRSLDHIAGGSSSGSAAAVASDMCCATLDTDAIGSCRLPAACCGVVGFKGTYGLIDPKGILEGEKADETIVLLSHPAVTARSVEDVALMLDVLAERKKQTAGYADEIGIERTLRVGVADNFKAAPEVTEAFEQAVEIIRAFGFPVSRASAPFRDPSGGIANIQADRERIAEQAFKEIDVLLLPTTPTTVPTIAEVEGNPLALSPELTAFANYYGLPAISVPCGVDSGGLPLGLQVVGRPWDEGAVLYLAGRYQRGVAAAAG